MITRGRIKNAVVISVCAFVLSSCGASREQDAMLPNMNEEISSSSETLLYLTELPGSEELLDAFLAGEVPAIYDVGEESEGTFMISEFSFGEEEREYYSIGERIDLDNDGENEQILDGPYGGMYFDVRDGRVYVLAEGEGTSGVLSYTEYDSAIWIVHRDTSHVGRQRYWLTKYDGEGNIADEFQLSAEYWELPSGEQYNENSDFTYRDKKISMKEYEALRDEIFGLESGE